MSPVLVLSTIFFYFVISSLSLILRVEKQTTKAFL